MDQFGCSELEHKILKRRDSDRSHHCVPGAIIISGPQNMLDELRGRLAGRVVLLTLKMNSKIFILPNSFLNFLEGRNQL